MEKDIPCRGKPKWSRLGTLTPDRADSKSKKVKRQTRYYILKKGSQSKKIII